MTQCDPGLGEKTTLDQKRVTEDWAAGGLRGFWAPCPFEQKVLLTEDPWTARLRKDWAKRAYLDAL